MLTISSLTKTYKYGKTAVKDLSLDIKTGDIYGFIGHNGAGKTTAIKAVVGIHDFEKGTIMIEGHSIKTEPMLCKSVMAYVPDNPELYDHLTGYQYLNFVADIYNIDVASRKQRISRYADEFELTGDLGGLISSYSRGMKQKTAIISALIHEPKLMVLDEPFSGLDPKASVILKRFMKEFCNRGGAIFFSTHVLEVVEKLCNKIAIIREGSLITAGLTSELTNGQSLEEVFMEVVSDDKAL